MASAAEQTSAVDIPEYTGEPGLPGYYGLAAYMGESPERTHVRIFPELLNLEILHRQAQIIDVKKRLYDQLTSDLSATDAARPQLARDWATLVASKANGNGEQSELLEELFGKLEIFREAPFVCDFGSLLTAFVQDKSVLRQREILDLSAPNHHDLKELQDYLSVQCYHGKDLLGPDKDIWSRVDKLGSFKPGLVTLRSRYYEDRFSRWISDNVLQTVFGWFEWTPGESETFGTVNDDTILWLTFLFTCALSTLLPFGFIVVLYFVKSGGKRLIVVGLSGLIFAAALAAFTNARRSEVFVASCRQVVSVASVRVDLLTDILAYSRWKSCSLGAT